MSFSFNRFSAIVLKEAKDLKNNYNSLLMCFLPIFLAFIYGRVIEGFPAKMGLVLCLLMSSILVGSFVQSMIIAEEKEKNTLRVLMLSPATELEVLLGKSFITFVVSYIVSILCIFAVGESVGNILIFIIFNTLVIVFSIILGTIVGLYSKNSMETGVVGFPVYMIFMMIPVFAPGAGEFVKKIAKLLPTYHFSEAMYKSLNGYGLSNMTMELTNMLIWCVFSFILCLLLYRNRKLDK